MLKCYFEKDLGEHSFGALLASSVPWQVENDDEFHTNLAVGRNEKDELLGAGLLPSLAFCSGSARETQKRNIPQSRIQGPADG